MATNNTVYTDDIRWTHLEEACVIQSQGTLPLILQRSIPSYNRYMKNTKSPRAVLGGMRYANSYLLYWYIQLPITNWKCWHSSAFENWCWMNWVVFPSDVIFNGNTILNFLIPLCNEIILYVSTCLFHSETQFLRVMLYNPLKIALQLSNITLDWLFQAAGEDDYTHNSKVCWTWIYRVALSSCC